MAGKRRNKSLTDSRKMLDSFILSKSVFAVTLKENHRVVGFVGFYEDTRIRNDERYCHLKALEIDYLISKKHWGQGLAVEAVRAVANYCFNDLGLDALIATYALSNTQSKRVSEKSGFKYIKPSVFYSEAENECSEGEMTILFSSEFNNK